MNTARFLKFGHVTTSYMKGLYNFSISHLCWEFTLPNFYVDNSLRCRIRLLIYLKKARNPSKTRRMDCFCIFLSCHICVESESTLYVKRYVTFKCLHCDWNPQPLRSLANTQPFIFSSKELLDIPSIAECKFSLNAYVT